MTHLVSKPVSDSHARLCLLHQITDFGLRKSDDARAFWDHLFTVEDGGISSTTPIHSLLAVLAQAVASLEENWQLSRAACACYMRLLQVEGTALPSWNKLFRQSLIRLILKQTVAQLVHVRKETNVPEPEDVGMSDVAVPATTEEDALEKTSAFKNLLARLVELLQKFALGHSLDSILFAIDEFALLATAPKDEDICKMAFGGLSALLTHVKDATVPAEQDSEKPVDAALDSAAANENESILSAMMRRNDELDQKTAADEVRVKLPMCASAIFKSILPVVGMYRPMSQTPQNIPKMWRAARCIGVDFVKEILQTFPELWNVHEIEFEHDDADQDGTADAPGTESPPRQVGDSGTASDLDIGSRVTSRTEKLDPFVNLIQHLCIHVADRGDYRTGLCETVVEMLENVPDAVLDRVLQFLVDLLGCHHASRRMIAAEVCRFTPLSRRSSSIRGPSAPLGALSCSV